MLSNYDKTFFETFFKALVKSCKKISSGEELGRLISGAMSKVLPATSDSLLKNLKSRSEKMLADRRRYISGFEKRLYKRWKKPIDLLEMLIVMAYEMGEDFNKEHRKEAAKNADYVFDVLARMHARGCQISHEILSLLKQGYADGAFARWRTLYEINVITLFIKEQGQEVAKRFLEHEIVDSFKRANEYQKHCGVLGYKRIGRKDMKNIKTNYDRVCKRYGKSFAEDYGWIPEKILKAKNFRAIEKYIGFDKLRPYYQMACITTHAGVKGIKFRMGLLKDDKLLAGPSNYGLADPGQSTAHALCQLTTWLLAYKTTIEGLIFLRVIEKISHEIIEGFCKVQFDLEKECR